MYSELDKTNNVFMYKSRYVVMFILQDNRYRMYYYVYGHVDTLIWRPTV